MRLVLSAAFILLASGFVTTVLGQVQFGVNAGIGLADIAVVHTDEFYLAKPSLVAGIYGSLPLTDRIHLTSSLLYTNKGTRTKNELTGEKSYLNLHYVSLPVLLRYHFVPSWYVEAGPEVGYLVTTRLRSNAFAAVDGGVELGSGYHISDKTSLGVRYYIGVPSVVPHMQFTNASGKLIYDVTVKLQNRFLQLTAAHRLF